MFDFEAMENNTNLFEDIFKESDSGDMFFQEATPEPVQEVAAPVEIIDEKTVNRQFVGMTRKNLNRSHLSFFYLNKDSVDIERWDAQLLKSDGKAGLSLTYGIKDFIISFDCNGTRASDLYIARFFGMKRKNIEGLNHITINMSLEKYIPMQGEYVKISECVNEIDWPKGQPLHDLWESLASTTIELLLGVQNQTDTPIISGKIS